MTIRLLMKPAFAVALCSCSLYAQTVDRSKTQGNCSPIVSGSKNDISINCSRISQEQAQKMSALLNKILANQLDASVVMEKLDEILQRLPSDRRIPVNDTQLISILRRNPSSANVLAETPNREAQQLGLDIYAILHNAGWTTRDQSVRGFMSVGGPTQDGIVVFTHGQPINAGETLHLDLPNNDPLLVLQDFCKSAKLKCVFERRMETPEGSYDIQVGPNPPAT